MAASASGYFYKKTNLTLSWDTLDKDLLPGTYLVKAYTQYYSNSTWYDTTAVNCYVYIDSINPFTDVAETASYYFAVMWAYKNGVVGGTSKTTFSPDDPCRRYQVVQMLYKLNGKPAVSASNPFKDVKPKNSFYDAVLWAVNSGIVSGTSKTTFSPQNSCERYQVVQMLYKMAGKPSIGSVTNPFKDIKKTDSYYNAVMWAVKKSITAGTSDTKFSPHKTCTRYQIVVFLYKYNNIYKVK